MHRANQMPSLKVIDEILSQYIYWKKMLQRLVENYTNRISDYAFSSRQPSSINDNLSTEAACK